MVTSLYPPHTIGGYEQACADVVHRWVSGGDDVRVLTSTYEIPGLEDVDDDQPFVERRLVLHDPPLGALGPRRRQLAAVEARNHRALAGVLRRFDPDVVSVWHMGGLSLSLLHQLRLRRRPTVLVVCDGWPLYAPPTDPLVSRLPRGDNPT